MKTQRNHTRHRRERRRPRLHERESAKKPRVTLKLSETGDTYVAYATFASGTLALQSIAPVEE